MRLLLGSVPAGGPALHGHRFDWYRLVVFEAVLAGEGEEGVDDCDPASSSSQFGSIVINKTGYLANLASVG